MKILIVLTSHGQLGTTGRDTGYWLEELAAPYYAFLDVGAELTLASPAGGRPPVDPASATAPYANDLTRRFETDAEAQAAVGATIPLRAVFPEDYDAVFYPGGHGVMWDLAEEPDSITILEEFSRTGRPTALVCHAAGVLRGVKTPEGRPLVEGRHVTGFSNAEEAAIGLTDVVPFLVEESLKAAGGRYSSGADWGSFVVQDGTLITGQNPESSLEAARLLLAALATREPTPARP